jgi:hypothetical protein
MFALWLLKSAVRSLIDRSLLFPARACIAQPLPNASFDFSYLLKGKFRSGFKSECGWRVEGANSTTSSRRVFGSFETGWIVILVVKIVLKDV